jgi:hypothetical protein
MQLPLQLSAIYPPSHETILQNSPFPSRYPRMDRQAFESTKSTTYGVEDVTLDVPDRRYISDLCLPNIVLVYQSQYPRTVSLTSDLVSHRSE